MELEVGQVNGYLKWTGVGKNQIVGASHKQYSMRSSKLEKLKRASASKGYCGINLRDRTKQGRCREDPKTRVLGGPEHSEARGCKTIASKVPPFLPGEA